MVKKYLIVFLAINFLITGLVFAQTGNDAPSTDLVPSNPLYFLKEWGRGIRIFFTFNPISRAELELRFVDQKATEVKKVQELEPANASAVNDALEKYQKSQDRLKKRLEAIKETSENPNVEKLLDKLSENSVRHEKLFDELLDKFADKAVKESLEKVIKNTQSKTDDLIIAASIKDAPDDFATRLERALIVAQEKGLEHLRSVEFIDRFRSRTDEKLQQSLLRLRENFIERLKEDIEEFADEEDEESFQRAVKEISGDDARHSVILEEIAGKFDIRKSTSQIILRTIKSVGKDLESQSFIAEKAKQQLKAAEELVSKLEILSDKADFPVAAKQHLANAQSHLKTAKAAFEKGNFGETFGLARSAEVLARNAFNLLEKEPDNQSSLEQILKELALRIEKYASILELKKYTPELNPKAFALLTEAKKHLEFARSTLTNNDRAGTELHIGHINSYLNALASFIEEASRPVIKPLPLPPLVTTPKPSEPVYCTQEYNPVCGNNKRTYSNECFAKVSGVTIDYRGECKLVPAPDKEAVVE